MPNGINDISPDLRDWLLNKNLILADSITDGGLAGLAVGLGQVAQVETLPNAVQPSTSIVDNGQFYRDLNLLSNPYKSLNGNEEIDINTNTIINIGNLPPGSLPLGYQQNIGSDNPTSPFNIEADEAREQMLKNKYFDAEFLYKVNLNTVFVSPESDGVYKIKESIIARTIDTALNAVNLGGVAQQVGVIGDDTPLGTIGDQELVKHFGYNAAFGLAQETLGHINANPLSLLQGNDIFVPNFAITVAKGDTAGVGDFASRVLGFELPVSLLDTSSSPFSSENPVDNIRRAQAMVENTGKGQVLAMIDNLNQNKYRPTITDNRKRENITKGDTGTNGDLYAFEAAEKGRITELLNMPPRDENSTETVSNEEFETTYGKITSELDGGFNSEFDDLTNKATSFNDVDDRGNGEWATTKFTWTDDKNKKGEELGVFSRTDMKNPKSLLYKTQALFNSNKTRNLITAQGDIQISPSEIETAVSVGSNTFISKGSGVKSLSAIEGTAIEPDDVFCRVWTTFDRYNQVHDLQKNDGLNNQSGLRLKNRTESSLLDSGSNGFVKVAPYASEPNVKKFMLSLENLAWDGPLFSDLPECEQGLGDPVTGTRGRLMWFPPYDLQFTDTTSVNWDSTNFIGRGEPIYTYNNTERTGTLGFKVIVDYATYMNDMRVLNSDNDLYNSIAAGCIDFDREVVKQLSKSEKDKIDVENAEKPQIIEAEITGEAPEPFKVYFPNDATAVPTTYEDGIVVENAVTYSDGITFTGCKPFTPGKSTAGCNCAQKNSTDFGLNVQPLKLPSDAEITDFPTGWQGGAYLIALAEYIVNKAPSVRIYIDGWASSDGTASANATLSQSRANNVKQRLESQLIAAGDPLGGRRFGQQPKGKGVANATSCKPKTIKSCDPQPGVPDVDAKCKKESRVTTISFKKDPALQQQIDDAIKVKEKSERLNELSREIKSRFIDECSYFEKMEQDSPFIYDRISEKIAFFHPAFHSTTPEGFNSRLNFLMQCTRQGPTPNSSNDPSNLAFGKAPVCILRLGDFYNTKIVIDNVDLSFDPLVWDLNPEGVGVQPMIANVMLSFKFIGGSSLSGPINRLQNAVSFNYFANTEIYETRSDYIEDGEYRNGFAPTDDDALREFLNESEQEGLGTNNNVPVNNQLSEAERANSNEENQPEDLGSKNFTFVNYEIGIGLPPNSELDGTTPVPVSVRFTISSDEELNKDEYPFDIILVDSNTGDPVSGPFKYIYSKDNETSTANWVLPLKGNINDIKRNYGLKGIGIDGYPMTIISG